MPNEFIFNINLFNCRVLCDKMQLKLSHVLPIENFLIIKILIKKYNKKRKFLKEMLCLIFIS